MDILNESLDDQFTSMENTLQKSGGELINHLRMAAEATKEIYQHVKHERDQRWPKGRKTDWYTYSENAGFTLSGKNSPSKIGAILKKKLDVHLKHLPNFGKALKNQDWKTIGKNDKWEDFHSTIYAWASLENALGNWHDKLDSKKRKELENGWARGLDAPTGAADDNLDHLGESWPKMPKLVDLTLLKM